MDTKEINVVCPCCGSRLEVDVRTGAIVRWRKQGEVDETGKPVLRESDWTAASERVGKRLGTAEDRFEQGLTREKTREQDLDDLFRRANDKLERKRDEKSGG